MKTELIRLALLSIYFTALAICFPSCEKQEECYIFTLGNEGEYYEAIPTNGERGEIFIQDGKVKQLVCK